QENFTVNFPISSTMSRPLTTDSVTQSLTVGVLTHLSGDWRSELDYTWSQNSFEHAKDGYDYTAFPTALADATVNPFVATIGYPLNLVVFFSPLSLAGRSTLNDLGLRASGPLWALAWGRPTLTVGLEHRKEGSGDSNGYFIYPLTPANTEHDLYFGQSQSTDS